MNDNQSSIRQPSEGTVEQLSFGTTSIIHHNLADLPPASSEVGFLWNNCIAASMSTCFLTKWAKEATDPDIKEGLQMELEAAATAWQDTKTLFESIDYPVPAGFGEQDIDIQAPALFSQSFHLLFTRMMQRMLIQHLVPAVTSAYRQDFQDFFHGQIKTAADRHRQYTEILLAKGVLQRHPTIVRPQQAEIVHDKDFLGSYFSVFGKQRSLTAVEIGHIYSIMEIEQLIRTFLKGYSQVVQSDKVRKYLLKAGDAMAEQLDALGGILTDEDLSGPSISEALITDSTTPEMSDRLVLSLATAVTAFIATSYGEAISTMARKDLGVTMMRFITEILSLAKDGAELSIELGWLEKSPQTAERKELSH